MDIRVAHRLVPVLVSFGACASAPTSSAAPAATLSPEDFTLRTERPTDRETVLTRAFAAPRADVFAALTEPASIRQWLGATGFTFVTCEIDLRVGGRVRYVFARASGRRIEVRGEYESVDPPRGFAWRETYDFSPLVVHVRTELTEHGNGTQLRQVLTYGSKAERDEDFPGVATSSREAFERLDRLLRKAP